MFLVWTPLIIFSIQKKNNKICWTLLISIKNVRTLNKENNGKVERIFYQTLGEPILDKRTENVAFLQVNSTN